MTSFSNNSTYLLDSIFLLLMYVPFAEFKSIRYGLTRFPANKTINDREYVTSPTNSPAVPSSRVNGTRRYWSAACCFEHDGWSTGKSTTLRSRPMRYALSLWMYSVCKAFSPLNGYRRHRRFGLRASGGSLYLMTTPR
jgi:hypothetical protein